MIHGFSPLVAVGARRLILGSMPGQASLDAGQYYAHPRNTFWRIMGDLLGAAPDLPYAERLGILQLAGLAVWDVLAACERDGSLDADIIGDSARVNDFSAFFAVHRDIHEVFFNGAAAEQIFRRQVLPSLSDHVLRLVRLPSTSPAHAVLRYAEKLAAWSAIAASPDK